MSCDVLHIWTFRCQHHHKTSEYKPVLSGKPRNVLSLNAIVDALNHDPDVATVAPEEHAKVMVSLYTLTWCDFTSFFVSHGKATFLQTFYKCANLKVNLSGSR